MELFVLLLSAITLASLFNMFRHFLPRIYQKLLINSGFLLFLLVPTYFLDIPPYAVLSVYILIVLSMAFYFHIIGALVSIIVGLLLGYNYGLPTSHLIELFIIYISILFLTYLLFRRIKQSKDLNENWISQLMKQSKQLHVYREIGTMMQQTSSLDKQLLTILTALTAGHGLGFNRAIIFLKVNEDDVLYGRMAVGPRTAEEGFHIWENIAAKKYQLTDLIEINNNETHTDLELNDIVQSLVIPLNNQHSSAYKAMKTRTPSIITENHVEDDFQQQMKLLFQMEEYAIVPLIHKGNEIGIVVIDNVVNKKPITLEDLEGVLPFANQAAVGIEQATMYEKMEQLAKRDGLTGLYNQRSLQQTLRLLFQDEQVSWPVSLIMIDIDFFKHFNDRNGHLLGNEVLIQLANLLQTTVGKGHSIYRFGGEELSIVMPKSNAEAAYELAEKIRHAVTTTRFPEGQHQPLGMLTISIGAACTEDLSTLSKDALISAADEALYAAKNNGKNRTVVFKGE
ncbi:MULTISPECIES: sensor domain-containing diguanylate cyclase [Bacillus]|uniref:sensor domain-containing diguanylate cyclase n=1 Tax=Bacillus TaxID=1386 RepID=UPI000BB762A2|nr:MULTISPECIES: sensor domain-containing diguanylate cyclase [Bacillus]